MNDPIVPAIVLALSSLGFALCAAINMHRVDVLHAEAVTRGYAEWRVDPQTGSTTWAWKEPVEKKP